MTNETPPPSSRPPGTPPAWLRPAQPDRPWYRTVESVLYSTAAAGMFFNLLSTTIGYRGVAAFALASLVLFSALVRARRLRTQRPEAPFTQTALPALITTATVCALAAALAALVPAWTTPATITAAAFLAIAVGLTATLEKAGVVLFGISAIAGGMACVAIAMTMLLDRYTLYEAGFVGLGIALACGGLAILVNQTILQAILFLVAPASMGMALVCIVIGRLLDHDILAAVATGSVGVMFVAFIADVVGRAALGWATMTSAGVTSAVAGIGAMLLDQHAIPGWIAPVGGGLALACVGIGGLLGHNALSQSAYVGFGIASVSIGIYRVVSHDILLGAGAVGLGIVVVGQGLFTLRRDGTFAQIQHRIHGWFQDPSAIDDPNGSPPNPDPGAAEPL